LPLTLLPFLTDLRATYDTAYVTTLLYVGANIACEACLLASWNYASRHDLLRKIAPVVDRSMRRRILLGIAINVVGAAAALINPHLSTVFFLMLPVLYLSHRAVDSHWNGEAGDTA
jgi:uncharacterized membrane protein